ncbi:hypothetical protein GLW08_16740 [Pontibacillus yanchengensis]|uniref:Uncharacterized protein n=1 Tax=Pontibacillus yanchengensis TaxID=462910 RepID=A0ACC7VJ43_9BACI|nr:hypothetical protein [Pontibacillus yanchengensis]MYL54983.1 hypothetical protein [Pontibacillus yanchengensis]
MGKRNRKKCKKKEFDYEFDYDYDHKEHDGKKTHDDFKGKKHGCLQTQYPVQISLGYVDNGAIAIKDSNASDNPYNSAVSQDESNASDNPYNSAVAQEDSEAKNKKEE